MKRIMSILVICIMAAAVSLTAFAENMGKTSASDEQVITWGQAAQKRGLENIKSNLYYAEVDEWVGIEIPVLKKSRTIKNCFVLKEDEQLVIPAGKTLRLTGGADIHGSIYIEEGGSLVLDKLSVILTGDIVCYGDISMTNGTLACRDGSMLYIAERGNLKASDRGVYKDGLNGRISADIRADVVCLGSCNIPDPTFTAEPIAAVYCRTEFGGVSKDTKVVTEGLAELLETELTTDTYYEDSSFYDLYTVLFSGGGCIDFVAMGSIKQGWSSIGRANVQALDHAAQIYHGSLTE